MGISLLITMLIQSSPANTSSYLCSYSERGNGYLDPTQKKAFPLLIQLPLLKLQLIALNNDSLFIFSRNTIREFQILHMQNFVEFWCIKIPICGHFVVILTPKNIMLCIVLTSLRKQNNLACHFIVTVWDWKAFKSRF